MGPILTMLENNRIHSEARNPRRGSPTAISFSIRIGLRPRCIPLTPSISMFLYLFSIQYIPHVLIRSLNHGSRWRSITGLQIQLLTCPLTSPAATISLISATALTQSRTSLVTKFKAGNGHNLPQPTPTVRPIPAPPRSRSHTRSGDKDVRCNPARPNKSAHRQPHTLLPHRVSGPCANHSAASGTFGTALIPAHARAE